MFIPTGFPVAKEKFLRFPGGRRSRPTGNTGEAQVAHRAKPGEPRSGSPGGPVAAQRPPGGPVVTRKEEGKSRQGELRERSERSELLERTVKSGCEASEAS